MKKNGFIATSIMYSFFAVFSIVALFTLASYSHYRTLIDNINDGVLDELNTLISGKYLTLYNLIIDGDFDDTKDTTSWNYTNSQKIKNGNVSTSINTSYSGDYAARLKPKTTSQISQSFTITNKVNPDSASHKIYVAYRISSNGPNNGTNSIVLNASGNNYNLDSTPLNASFNNWNLYSQIISVNVNSDAAWSLAFNINNNTNNTYTFLDNIMVIDISDMYNSSSVTDIQMKTYLDTNLNYFNGSYSISKISDEYACSYTAGKTWTFSYNGSYQKFSSECSGRYQIELWGASSDLTANAGALGAYTSGTLKLYNDSFYIYVGGMPTTYVGGYNGGGSAFAESRYQASAAGGGATDIRTTGGTWNDATSLNSRIMVAAAAGGNSHGGHGAYGGTLAGFNGIPNDDAALTGADAFGYRGIQTSGGAAGAFSWTGTAPTAGGFGYGGNGNSAYGGGGGSGYYGGGGSGVSTASKGGGGSGSSFISGYLGCVAITSATSTTPRMNSTGVQCINSNAKDDVTCSYHYSGYVFTGGTMIAGNASMPTHDGASTMVGNNGNGYAKITFLG